MFRHWTFSIRWLSTWHLSKWAWSKVYYCQSKVCFFAWPLSWNRQWRKIKNKILRQTWVPEFAQELLVGSVLLIWLDFCVVLLCVFTFWFTWCPHTNDVRFVFTSSCLSYLSCLCLFVHSDIQQILCCVFVLFVFVMYLVCPWLPVSLDCPFLIAPRYSLTFIYIR